MQSTEVKIVMRKIWDESAPTFDSRPGHGIHSEREKRSWQNLLCEALPPGRCDVLDVGCGTGVMALLLAEMGHKVTGVDISEAMLERAREKAACLGLPVEFKCGDAEELPFKEGIFDAVVSRHVLWALPNPEKAVAEWKRVLKPGGRVIIIDGNWGANRSLLRRTWRFFGQLLILITEHRNPWPRWRYQGIDDKLPMRHRERPQADIAILESTGFKDIEVVEVNIPRTRGFLEFLKCGSRGRLHGQAAPQGVLLPALAGPGLRVQRKNRQPYGGGPPGRPNRQARELHRHRSLQAGGLQEGPGSHPGAERGLLGSETQAGEGGLEDCARPPHPNPGPESGRVGHHRRP